ncbi:unnamed protein product [Cladocopium goreaui]|uniref:Phosphodiesterase n=1 Tax=Cladocopium goreaui TaxID=2562237 RepID=A0A9P1DU58_9DINO|nr:unnamed protein product [Cladocopium goreaui]
MLRAFSDVFPGVQPLAHAGRRGEGFAFSWIQLDSAGQEPQRRRSKPVVHLPRSATSASPERRAGLGGRAPLPLDSDALYEGWGRDMGSWVGEPCCSAVSTRNMGKDCGIQKQAILLARGEFDKRGAVPYASAVVSSNNALLGFSDPSTVQRKPFSGRHWVVLEDEKNKTPCEHEENLRTLSRVSHVSLPWRVAGVNNLTTHEVSLLEGELLRDVSIGKNFDATAIQEQLDHFEKQLRAALAQKRTGEGMRDVRQKEAEEQQRWRLQHLQSRPQAGQCPAEVASFGSPMAVLWQSYGFLRLGMVGSALPGDLNAFQRQSVQKCAAWQSNRTTDEKQIQRLPTAQAAGEANVAESRLPSFAGQDLAGPPSYANGELLQGQRGQRSPEAPEAESRLPSFAGQDLAGPPSYANGELLQGQRGQQSPEAPEAESRLPSFAGQDLAGPPSYANGELLQGQRGQRSPEAPEAESRLPSFAGQDLAGGATGCLGLGSTGAKAKELVAPDDSVDTAPRRPRRELLCFEEEGLLEGISQLKSDTVRRQDLLTKGTEELARLKLLISLGTDRRRCHRCDLAICSLRSLLSCLVQVCEATEVNEGDADLLAEMAKILASVAHVDAQLAEMALWLGEVFTQ